MILDIEGILDCPWTLKRPAVFILFFSVNNELKFVNIQGEAGPEGNICISWTP